MHEPKIYAVPLRIIYLIDLLQCIYFVDIAFISLDTVWYKFHDLYIFRHKNKDFIKICACTKVIVYEEKRQYRTNQSGKM